MKTSRIKVANLLMAGFGLMCLLLSAVIALALQEQAKLNAATAGMADDRWPKIELATGVRLRVTDIAVSLRNIMLSDDAGVRMQEIDNIHGYRRDIEAAIAQLDRRVVTPSGRAALARVRTAYDGYTAGQERLIALEQADRNAEANTLLNTELKAMLQACRAALANQIDNEVALMRQAREDAAHAYTRNRATMLGLGVAALLLSSAAAALIIMRLRRALGGEPDQAAHTAARIAEGDLSAAITLRPGDQVSMLYEMERMRASLGGLVAQVRADTDLIAAASTQIASGNLDLSARTEQQAASLQETAAAMEQLTVTVQQNADHARRASDMAQQASQAAGKGGAAVAAVSDRMAAIRASSAQMADIVGIIDALAFQTNILALNAAVEAARAGEQGRGFAVVAGEVRQLAHRSADAARQVGALIKASVAQADAGGEQVRAADVAMQEIVTGVARVADLLGQIRHASAEQHQGIATCSDAVVQMDQGTQQNAALVEQVAAAAQSLQEQSVRLAQAMGRFRIAEPRKTPAPAKATPAATPSLQLADRLQRSAA